MTSVRTRMRQLVDWGAALRSGLLCGALVFILSLVFSGILLKDTWFYTRLVSSLVMGLKVLLTPTAFDPGYLLLSLAVHMVMALLIAFLIAIIVHKYGILISVVGGALIGLAIYVIGFYAFNRFFPWLPPFRSWIYMVEFVFYGAIAGGIYELLEVEVFVPEGSKQL
jgi:hypothetical protein